MIAGAVIMLHGAEDIHASTVNIRFGLRYIRHIRENRADRHITVRHGERAVGDFNIAKVIRRLDLEFFQHIIVVGGDRQLDGLACHRRRQAH